MARRERFIDPGGWKTYRPHPANVWRDVALPDARIWVVLFTSPDGSHKVILIDLAAGKQKCILPGFYETRRDVAAAAFEAVEELQADSVGDS